MKLTFVYIVADCPTGWKYHKDGSCYHVLSSKLINFPSSVEQCRIEGDKVGQRGTLAEPRTKNDLDFMFSLYKRTSFPIAFKYLNLV